MVGEQDVHQRALDMVGFIYPQDFNPEDSAAFGATKPYGTAFFLKVSTTYLAALPAVFYYLITNKHVLQNSPDAPYEERIKVRLNNKTKTLSYCTTIDLVSDTNRTDLNVFPHPRNEVDLVAVEIEAPFREVIPEGYFKVVQRVDLARDVAGSFESIGVVEGTDTFTVGYLYGYAGLERNYPIILSGKLSMISNEFWFVSERNRSADAREQAYVAQLPVTSGSSGSPVILNPSFTRTVMERREEGLELDVVHGIRDPQIIGIIKGTLDHVKDGIYRSQGLAAIEPASNLIELIDRLIHPHLVRRGHTIVG